VVGARAGLADRHGALVEGACMVEVALVVQDVGEVVNAVGGGGGGVVRAQALLCRPA